MTTTAPEPRVEETPVASLSTTATGLAVPTAALRARIGSTRRRTRRDVVAGWVGPIVIAGIALVLRLWHLSRPHSFLFDETWYAKDAFSLLNFGYAQNYKEDVDKLILNGQTTDLWTGDPSMIVHPEVGKWIIALGEKMFGMDPLGWRIMPAVFGALMVLVMCRFVRRMTGSTLLGCLGGLLMAVDGLHLVLSRLALLDIFVAFWLLCAVHCVVADRQWFRRRLAKTIERDESGQVHGWGPIRATLFRPWLLAGGICFGLAVGTKWGALYPLAIFGILVFLWSAGARRSFGVSTAWAKSALSDGPVAFVHLVVVGLVVYLLTWTGWLMHAGAYEDTYSYNGYTQSRGAAEWPTASEPDASGLGEVTQSFRSLWYYHQDVYEFHTNGLLDSTHPYQSKPIGWLLMDRPVGVDWQSEIQPGQQGCDADAGSTCVRQVLLLGNPLIWWGGAAALIAGLALWVGGRDWRWSVVMGGVASTWLPWLQYDDRPIFYFYAIAVLPFTLLGLVLVLGKIIGGAADPTSGHSSAGSGTADGTPAPSRRRTLGVIAVGTFVVLTIMASAYFWPIWVDGLMTYDGWSSRMWFSRWIGV